jgi:hypothetical protein
MGFKEDFKAGCEKAGGTWIDDADGSFGCSIGTVQIKCVGESCKIAASIAPEVDINVGLKGDRVHTVMALLSSAKPTQSGFR